MPAASRPAGPLACGSRAPTRGVSSKWGSIRLARSVNRLTASDWPFPPRSPGGGTDSGGAGICRRLPPGVVPGWFQDPGVVPGVESHLAQVGRRLDDVLAIVQDQQHPAGPARQPASPRRTGPGSAAGRGPRLPRRAPARARSRRPARPGRARLRTDRPAGGPPRRPTGSCPRRPGRSR